MKPEAPSGAASDADAAPAPELGHPAIEAETRVEPAESEAAIVRERTTRIVDRGVRVRRERIAAAASEPHDAAPIEITIGRIDVRAVVAAAPQKQPPKRPPVMTLEEYVAKRDGGGR